MVSGTPRASGPSCTIGACLWLSAQVKPRAAEGRATPASPPASATPVPTAPAVPTVLGHTSSYLTVRIPLLAVFPSPFKSDVLAINLTAPYTSQSHSGESTSRALDGSGPGLPRGSPGGPRPLPSTLPPARLRVSSRGAARLSAGRHATSCVIAPAAMGAPRLGTRPQERRGQATAAFQTVPCALCCVCRRAEKISLKRKQGPVQKACFGQPGCCWGTAPRVASLDAGLFPTFSSWCVSPSYTRFCFDQALADGPRTREAVGPQGPGLASASRRGQGLWAPPVGPDTGDLGAPGPYRQGIRQDPEDALPCASASALGVLSPSRIGQVHVRAGAPGNPRPPLSDPAGQASRAPLSCTPLPLLSLSLPVAPWLGARSPCNGAVPPGAGHGAWEAA